MTRQVLLEATADVCAEWGFDGTTLARIAARAGLSPSALYNHYESREELLYAAAVQGMDRILAVTARAAGHMDPASVFTRAYLRPEMRRTRRLFVEIHAASGRDAWLAELLAQWHRAWMEQSLTQLPPDDPHPQATVKALYLLLLGLCHFDDVPGVRAPRAVVADRAERAIVAITTVGSG